MDLTGQILRGIGFFGVILSGFAIVFVAYLFLFEGFTPAAEPVGIVGGAFAGSLAALLVGERMKDE